MAVATKEQSILTGGDETTVEKVKRYKKKYTEQVQGRLDEIADKRKEYFGKIEEKTGLNVEGAYQAMKKGSGKTPDIPSILAKRPVHLSPAMSTSEVRTSPPSNVSVKLGQKGPQFVTPKGSRIRIGKRKKE